MATTSEAVEQFLASLRARRAPANTIKAYTHDLRHFLAAVPTLLVEITAPLIQAFLQGDGHHSVATRGPTRGRRYSILCAFYH
jgi:site-specific recombinase XerD